MLHVKNSLELQVMIHQTSLYPSLPILDFHLPSLAILAPNLPTLTPTFHHGTKSNLLSLILVRIPSEPISLSTGHVRFRKFPSLFHMEAYIKGKEWANIKAVLDDVKDQPSCGSKTSESYTPSILVFLHGCSR